MPLVFSTRWALSVEMPKMVVFFPAAILVIAGTPWQMSWLKFRPAWPLLLLYGWRAMAGDLSENIELRLQFVLLGLLGWTWMNSGSNAYRRRWTLYYLAAATAVCLYSWLQRLGLDPFGWYSPDPDMLWVRTIATLGNPNFLAAFVAPSALMALRFSSRWAAALGLLAAMTVVASGTRAAMLGLAVGFVWLACRAGSESQPRRLRHKAAGLLLVTLPAALLLPTQPQALERNPDSHQVRIALWIGAEQLLEQHPGGLGPRHFGLAYLPYRGLEPHWALEKARVPAQCHNELLGIGVEAGWPGLLLWLTVSGLGLWRLRHTCDQAALLALLANLMFIRATLPVELIWLLLVAGDGAESDPPAARPAQQLGALLLSGAAILWVARWGVAENTAWWAEDERLRAEGELKLYAQAADQFLGAAELAPSFRREELNRQALSSLIDLYSQVRMPAVAEAIEDLLQVAPEHPYSAAQQARYLALRQDPRELKYRAMAITADPWNPMFWAAAGFGFKRQGWFGAARLCFKESLALRHDPRLQWEIEQLQPLRLSEQRRLSLEASLVAGAEPHLSAGSGVVEFENRLYVIADDADAMAVFEGKKPGKTIPLFPGRRLPADYEERKKLKPDLEALCRVDDLLLAWGSGSGDGRYRGCALSLVEGTVREFDLSAVYAALPYPDLNIEGAARLGDHIWLANRGNSSQGSDALVQLDLKMVLRGIQQGKIDSQALLAHRPVNLGRLRGIRLTFTDLTALGPDRLLFCAAAEDTDNPYDDGEIIGSALGVVSTEGLVSNLRVFERAVKLEGVSATLESQHIVVTLVSDADDPARAGTVYKCYYLPESPPSSERSR